MGFYTYVTFKCKLSKHGAKVLGAGTKHASTMRLVDVPLPPRCNAWQSLPGSYFFRVHDDYEEPPDRYSPGYLFKLSQSEEPPDDGCLTASGWQWEVRIELKNYHSEVEILCKSVLPYLTAEVFDVHVEDEGGRDEDIFVCPSPPPCSTGSCPLDGEIACYASKCGCDAIFCVVCEEGGASHHKDCALACRTPWTPQNHLSQPVRLQETAMIVLLWCRSAERVRSAQQDGKGAGAATTSTAGAMAVMEMEPLQSPALSRDVCIVLLSFLSGADFGY